MKFSLALSMGLALLPEMGAAAGGFYQSCRNNWRIERDHYMVAECRQNNGNYRRTSQDLNLCVANFNGKLASANNGNFRRSCYSCRQGEGLITADEPPSPYMTCICVGPNGEHTTDINLNTFVENGDGYLWCHGHRSSPI